MLDYLDRYRAYVFGHPRARDGEGRGVAVVERTNDPAEHFFSQGNGEPQRRLGRCTWVATRKTCRRRSP